MTEQAASAPSAERTLTNALGQAVVAAALYSLPYGAVVATAEQRRCAVNKPSESLPHDSCDTQIWNGRVRRNGRLESRHIGRSLRSRWDLTGKS